MFQASDIMPTSSCIGGAESDGSALRPTPSEPAGVAPGSDNLRCAIAASLEQRSTDRSDDADAP